MLCPVNCLVMVSLHRNRKITKTASQSGCQEISHSHTFAAADRAAPSHHDRKYPLHQHKPFLPCLASDMYACCHEKSSHWGQPYKHILGQREKSRQRMELKTEYWNTVWRVDRRKKTPPSPSLTRNNRHGYTQLLDSCPLCIFIACWCPLST